MKIIVTGGCGFIGANLIKYLIKNTKHDILNIDKLTYAGNSHSLAELERNPRYRLSTIDICDANAVNNAFDSFEPDAVMHLAAESHVDRSIDGPAAFIQTNILGTFQLLQAARNYFEKMDNDKKLNFRFLHVSTDEVFGSLGAEGHFTEETPYSPHSPYSASKAASDHLVRAWADTYGLPILITNCTNNYGPYQFPEKLIPVVILKALQGENIPIYGKGENIRDWLYVEDHVDALYTVLSKGERGETYAIGGNNELSNLSLVRCVCSILDELKPRPDGKAYADQITFVKDRPGHDLRYSIDPRKIKEKLGWEPKQDHQSGFSKTIQWYLDNESWWKAILNGSYRLDRIGLGSDS